ncbi:alpha/beta-hydrolase [Ramicandelaber brevisporus]|nr:alpha/beta-hydrolase [Ramicandelaber brevisporus]
MTKLLIPTKHGFSLVAEFAEAASGEPADVIVLVHGFTNTRRSKVLRFRSQLANYATMVFDLRGNGESGTLSDDGYRYPSDPTKTLPRSSRTRMGNYAEEAEDIDTVVEYIRTVMKRNVKCVVGHSKGASSVTLYAANKGSAAPPYIVNLAGRFVLDRLSPEDTRKTGLHGTLSGGPPVNYGPLRNRSLLKQIDAARTGSNSSNSSNASDAASDAGDDSRTGFAQFEDNQELFVLTYEDLMERFALSMGDVCSKIDTKNVKYLVIHGDADDVVPIEDAQLYLATVTKNADSNGGHLPQLHIMPGVDHMFVDEASQSHVAKAVAAFCEDKPLPSFTKS